ncbi:unnamed protein product [Ambrosiozyma monospora]|uniref:Unnamed protein product n=1 Tax=Ambrosiozyma monospora TaxID=43982 RepID=A0ACB5SXA2_AMBMO|nr:unnamed protein product [Ambrosiozyma monospora]
MDLIRDLQSKHPEIVPDFKSSVTKKMPIKVKKPRPSNLLMTSDGYGLKDCICHFPKQHLIDQIKREAKALQVAGQPEEELRKLVLALTHCVFDGESNDGLSDDDEFGLMLADFGEEIERMVSAIDRTVCNDEEFAELVGLANDTLIDLEEYDLSCRPFSGTRKFLKGLLKTLDVSGGEEEDGSDDDDSDDDYNGGYGGHAYGRPNKRQRVQVVHNRGIGPGGYAEGYGGYNGYNNGW